MTDRLLEAIESTPDADPWRTLTHAAVWAAVVVVAFVTGVAWALLLVWWLGPLT